MGLYKPTDQAGQPLNTIFAEDIGQLIDVLTGQRDAGALSLLKPLATPAAPTSVTLSSGGITGTGYQWAIYWITGILDGTGAAHITGRTPYGTLSASQNLTAQQATVSISGLLPAPTGAIGWGVARNKSGGATWYTVPGSEQFMSLAGVMPSSFVDNVADASLVSTAPTTNTTGTSLNAGVQTYTQAQWPPTGASQGTCSIIADTYGGLTFSWPLEDRPDFDSNYPWRSFGGKTASVARLAWYANTTPSAGTHNATSFNLPVAGVWTLGIGEGQGNTGASYITAGLGTTNALLDIVTSTGDASHLGGEASTSYTGTKGQTIYVNWSNPSGSNYVTTLQAFAAPVKVANA